MDGLESWTHWTNILNTAASCHGRIADLCWHLRFSAISADLKQWFPLTSIFHKLLTGECYEMVADCFLMFIEYFLISTFRSSTENHWFTSGGFGHLGRELEAIGAISGEVLGSLAISETCSVAELKRQLTVAHHWPGAVPWAVGGTTCRRSGSWPRYYICPRVYIYIYINIIH